MEVSFLPERTFGCSLLDDCALPWRRLTASVARVVQSAKSDDGATYGPALYVVVKRSSRSGLPSTVMVRSFRAHKVVLASQV